MHLIILNNYIYIGNKAYNLYRTTRGLDKL